MCTNLRIIFNEGTIKGEPYICTNWQDVGLTRNFISCPDMEPMPEFLWAKGQPSNPSGDADIVGMAFLIRKDQDFGHMDASPLWRLRAFCEV